MTNEQLFLYMTAIIRRLEKVMLDIDTLENPGERDTECQWRGDGVEPVGARIAANLSGAPLPDGYELVEVGLSAAAQHVDVFIDDLKEEIAFLVGGN